MYPEISEHTIDFRPGVDTGGNIVEVEPKFFTGSHPSCSLDQRLNEFGVDAPVAFLFGIG